MVIIMATLISMAMIYIFSPSVNVRLVIVGGKPIYGDRELMEKFVSSDTLEPVTVCNKPDAKVLYLSSESSAPPLKRTWRETKAGLDRALQQWKIKLADLAEDSECN